MLRKFLLLFSEVFFLHRFSILGFLAPQRVNGFFVQHPSGLPMTSHRYRSIATSSGDTEEFLLKSSSSSSLDEVVLDGKFPENNTTGSLSENEEIVNPTRTRYPWSEVQQWALRDNVPKYTIRIPVKQKKPFTDAGKTPEKQEDTVLTSFALWRSLQHDIPELSGYPIEFLRARHKDMNKEQQYLNDDDGSSKDVRNPTTPGVLPFLQDYEFSAKGGICGFVYGMDGVSDGSRIESSAVRNIKESLPKGFIQTTDGYASFELGNPMQTEQPNTENGMISASKSAVKELSLERITDTASTNELRSIFNNVDDGDGMLLRLGALSGFFLAGATAINMLSHHLTVNVFWV